MNAELEHVVAILERRAGQPSPDGPRFREPGLYFSTQFGHRLVLPQEQRPFLEFGSYADVQVIEYGAYAFGLAVRIELDNGDKAPWIYRPYVAHRDPGHPSPVANISEHALSARSLDLELVVPSDDDGTAAIKRQARLPYPWFFRLNGRVQRGLNCQFRNEVIDQAVSWLTTRIDTSTLDGLKVDCIRIALTD
jgi:hypothetical protein